MTYPIYSDNIWDYLQDMSYMPSRSDREYIKLKKDSDKRIKIWEYFFRIKPDDVGKPQKDEILNIEQMFKQEIDNFNAQVDSDKNYISAVHKETWMKYFKYSLSIILVFVVWKLIFQSTSVYTNVKCSTTILLFYLIMLTGMFLAKLKETLINSRISSDQSDMRSLLGMTIAKGRQRIIDLKCEIDALKRQIPEPYLDLTINRWLDQELFELWQKSKEKTGLGTRLVPIGSFDDSNASISENNPLSIMGPGELQDAQNIHPFFKKELNPDYNKHLSARRAFKRLGKDRKDVIYGVYYIEYIAIADDMLATYGLYYDFISGETFSEIVTEQYYKDVVSISSVNEFREIHLGDSGESIAIEDAPTVKLSLSSGEERKVTFVNHTYFWRMKEMLDVTDEEALNMDLVQVSDDMADKAVRALRYHLRKHKGNLESEVINHEL